MADLKKRAVERLFKEMATGMPQNDERVEPVQKEEPLKEYRISVDHPEHYNQYPMEVIDIIRRVLGPEGFKAYCLGNEIKYRMRAGFKKDQAEDIAKAMKYKQFREAE